ncbi:hypothetical protein C487_13989 [Natrinema pallidum DSM 3751]|uniref:DUF7344 domain-containing protein n=2 Tax=Natrinema pallidum TaxID=69527 RepID=L9YKQ1_9EURY|nr:hypothetical protein C487_13989 [Natrinema pallidum DSM 3751]
MLVQFFPPIIVSYPPMSSPPDDEPTSTALDVLAVPRRRYLLAALLERGDTSAVGSPVTTAAMSLTALATEVATTERDRPIVTDEQCARTRTDLVHAHVPRLVDIGVLVRIDDGDVPTVALADHPLLEAEWVRTLLDDPTGEAFPAAETTLNRTLEALRRPRRRTVCAALAARRGAVPLPTLAAAVVAREGGDGMRLVDVSEEEWLPVAETLTHDHLPALSDAGLVAYDDAAGRAALVTIAPQWESDWLLEGPLADSAVPIAAVRESSGGSTADNSVSNAATGEAAVNGDHEGDHVHAEGCETITGAGPVHARGRDIAAGADAELVVTVPDGSRLERECLEQWHAAAERGVDVYVGSQSPRVRDTVRSMVPDAAVCEPQFDWLNFPLEATQHGHVVFADRERALVVTTDGADSDAESRVSALAGDGRENPLVSVLRDHLGPRLDRLAAAHDDRDVRDGTPLPM